MKFIFPVNFVEKNGKYDLFAPMYNLYGNAGLISLNLAGVQTITYIALRLLGFKRMSEAVNVVYIITVKSIFYLSFGLGISFTLKVCYEGIKMSTAKIKNLRS